CGRLARRDDLLRPPRRAAVRGTALEDRVRPGGVGRGGPTVVGREDVAAVGDRQGRDPVVGESALAVGRELLLRGEARPAGGWREVVVRGGRRVVRGVGRGRRVGHAVAGRRRVLGGRRGGAA